MRDYLNGFHTKKKQKSFQTMDKCIEMENKILKYKKKIFEMENKDENLSNKQYKQWMIQEKKKS